LNYAKSGYKILFRKKIPVGAGSAKIYPIKSIIYKNPPFFKSSEIAIYKPDAEKPAPTDFFAVE
jgi:hypothetical protein